MNIVFMGTPDFSVPCLKSIVEAGHNVTAVFTQPDKPKNRGKQIQMTPVKAAAVELGIHVYQPMSLKKGEDGEKSLQLLKELAPDCIVVVAYGKILPPAILGLPKYGCINVHASLLPMYRGAAPIQWVIINGEKESGVTTMFMADGIDTGDMLEKTRVEIDERMTASELHDRLSYEGSRLILSTLKKLEDGTAVRTEQTGKTCGTSMITKEMCKIDFTKSAEQVYNFIRGMSSSPCAYTFLEGKRLKVYFSEKSFDEDKGKLPGEIINPEKFGVMCGDGKCLYLSDIQLEGNKRMKTEDFLRGRKLIKGTVLGEE